jgi:protein-S-isoprenylcysteine O-methyltransferase Ste14
MELHTLAVGLQIGLAAVTFVSLMWITAPYGRHVRSGWGWTIPARLGWIVMEAIAVFGFLAFYVTGPNAGDVVPLVLLGIWMVHYLHRTFIFPFRTRSNKPMPALIPAIAIAFNLLNAYVNGYWVGHLGTYSVDWLLAPRFLIGLAIFVTGMVINIHSDNILLKLRQPGESGYKIPQGGMYRFVSCPNYLGECLEWIGWAVMTWSTAGLAFALYTIANLLPRALKNHKWYQETFEEYPPRKAMIPGVL